MSVVVTYTPKLGKVVSRRIKAKGSIRFHVVSAGSRDGWNVVSENKLRSVGKFRTQQAAVTFAKKYGHPKSVDKVVVHDRAGRIKNVITI